MTTSETLKEAALARRLVAARVAPNEESAWALAHALTDIGQASTTLAQLITSLHEGEAADNELADALTDIGEELRQVLYHIHNAPGLDYLTAGDSED